MQRLLNAGFLTSFWLFATVASQARAAECQAEPVVADSTPYASRQLGAFPSSLVLWKRAVRARYGSEWDTWRRALDTQVRCRRKRIAGEGLMWICTRSARPCKADAAASLGSAGVGDAAKGPFPGRLRIGARNEAVRELQRLLVARGYRVTVDGVFGRGTRRAVRRFQRAEGLTVDGIVGAATWAAL